MYCPVCENFPTRHFLTVQQRDYWRCDVCQATFLDPELFPDEALERKLYTLHRNDPQDAGYRRFLSRLSVPLLQRLAPRQHGLDYGCGPGPVLAAMLGEAGHRVALYDPLFAADEQVLKSHYDFVTCTEVVEHFHHPATEFRRLDKLLKPGGWLAIMTCFQTEDARFANWHYRRDPTHVVLYREATLHELARRHGWQCEIVAKDVALMRKPVCVDTTS